MRLRVALAVAMFAALAASAQQGRIEIRTRDRVITNERDTPGAIRVLFVGNSLTYWNEMPSMLQWMAESAPNGPKLQTAFSGGSGMSLRQHWDRGRAVRAIRSRKWDYVVLQGQSSDPTRHEEFFKYARLLDAEIRRSGAKTIFFETWAHRGTDQNIPAAAYAKASRDFGAIMAPVGTAWRRVAARGENLYDGSGVHPSLAGSYLSACVFYAVITGRSPIGLKHRFDVKYDIPEFYRVELETVRLGAAEAESLQRVAWEVVRR